MIPEGSRGPRKSQRDLRQGFKGSSEMLKDYKDLKVWQKAVVRHFSEFGKIGKKARDILNSLENQFIISVISLIMVCSKIYKICMNVEMREMCRPDTHGPAIHYKKGPSKI